MAVDLVSQRTIDLLCLNDVHRWNVIRTKRPQSVAEHSFNVAVLVLELADRLGGYNDHILDVVPMAVGWAIMHDAPESITSDIDGKFKRDHPEIRMALNAAEANLMKWHSVYKGVLVPEAVWLVKIADKIEAIWYIKEFGDGTRAYSVLQELYDILHNELLVEAAGAINISYANLVITVDKMLNESMNEGSTIQCGRGEGV